MICQILSIHASQMSNDLIFVKLENALHKQIHFNVALSTMKSLLSNYLASVLSRMRMEIGKWANVTETFQKRSFKIDEYN